MGCRKINEKCPTKPKQKKQGKINILSYLHQIERNNCLGETELAPGKTLKSCENIL